MYFLIMAFVGVIGLFYYNTLGWLVNSWMNNEYYSHGLLVPLISGYIIWNMRNELASLERKQAHEGLAVFVAGLVLQGISVLWTIRFLSGISLILTISGVILYLFGREFIKKIWFPLFFLLLMVPLPFVDMVAAPAQTISAIASSGLANYIGLPVQREGLVLTIPAGSFEVGLECSGINSLISLLTIGIIFAFILEGKKTMKFAILLSAIPLALAGNIIRITSVLAVANKYGSNVAMNYFHDFSSMLMFSIALCGLFIVGRCFGRLHFKKIF
jgi:exosortase